MEEEEEAEDKKQGMEMEAENDDRRVWKEGGEVDGRGRKEAAAVVVEVAEDNEMGPTK